MILISHRGNLDGPNPLKENNPSYILEAIRKQFYVEIDVWLEDRVISLGHDNPEYEVGLDFLFNSKLWCHAKNLEALDLLLENKIKCFWHQDDDFTLTSNNFIWTFPKKNVINRSIIVCRGLEETKENYAKNIYGICSDYVGLLT